jgi:hypothetical protein
MFYVCSTVCKHSLSLKNALNSKCGIDINLNVIFQKSCIFDMKMVLKESKMNLKFKKNLAENNKKMLKKRDDYMPPP